MRDAIIWQDLSGYETVKFGPYEWLVLDRNKKGTLLITKEGISARPYHDKSEGVTWKNCSLRKWLNGEFLNRFTDAERARMLKRRVKNHDNPCHETPAGNDTRDRVFLLSIEEAGQYFEYDGNRICKPEKGAVAKGVYVAEGACFWWLRSPGVSSDYAAGVFNDGSINCFGYRVCISNNAVRPAMWVNNQEFNDTIEKRKSVILLQYDKEFGAVIVPKEYKDFWDEL